MLATVGRWYGYGFRLTDSAIASRHVTTVLHIAESTKTLTAIAQLLNVTMTFDGNIITLHPRRAGGAMPARRERRDLLSYPIEVGK
jgi:ferric-dicitrate binding protein FerR (iron transport regulator)